MKWILGTLALLLIGFGFQTQPAGVLRCTSCSGVLLLTATFQRVIEKVLHPKNLPPVRG